MAVTNLPYIQQQMIRYGLSAYLILGLFGNICNCIMFSRRQYRNTPNSIYFLYFSFFAIAYLLWAIIPFLYNLDHIDPQTQLVSFCKVRLYGSHVLGQCLRYLVTFACMDRFFATQPNVRVRSFSSALTAKILATIICPLWICFGCHMPILMQIRNGVCGMDAVYKFVYAIYQLTLAGLLPPALMSIFSVLTIRSLHQRHANQERAKRRDRDLIRMVFAQVMVNISTCIPFSINLLYGAITYYVVGKSTERLEIEAFASFAVQFIIYLISVNSFYMFLVTSKRFRIDFINIVLRYWYKYILRRSQVMPFKESRDGTVTEYQTMRTNNRANSTIVKTISSRGIVAKELENRV